VRIDGALPEGVTFIAVNTDGGTQALVFNPATGTFDGTLFLNVGTHSLVAKAFAGDTEVGESRPTTAEIQAGGVTRVLIQIFDIRPEAPPLFGPIFDSLTFPTSTEVNLPVTFALSVVAPAGDPVTYAWSSDCTDSTFSPVDAATTHWSKPTPGGCTIQVVATSNDFAVSKNFAITVFPAGAHSGAADVRGSFINRPQIQLSFGDVSCFVSAFSDSSCPRTIASPSVTAYSVFVSTWGGSTPGTIEISDDCGGRFGIERRSPDNVGGSWLPPVGGGLCKLTARATSSDGELGTMVAAILTRPGTAAVAQPVFAQANLEDGCQLVAGGNSCGVARAGLARALNGFINYGSNHAGTVTVSDDCAGPLPPVSTIFFNPNQFVSQQWTPVLGDQPSRTCTTTLHATSLEGGTADISVSYLLLP
jgi:hypothetical protein